MSLLTRAKGDLAHFREGLFVRHNIYALWTKCFVAERFCCSPCFADLFNVIVTLECDRLNYLSLVPLV